MRIYEMINEEKLLWSAIKFSQLILKGNEWRSVWRICMWILGLRLVHTSNNSPKWQAVKPTFFVSWISYKINSFPEGPVIRWIKACLCEVNLSRVRYAGPFYWAGSALGLYPCFLYNFPCVCMRRWVGLLAEISAWTTGILACLPFHKNTTKVL